MSARSFNFLVRDTACWAMGHVHDSGRNSVTLTLRAPGSMLTLDLTPGEARAMAVALEAAATHAENTLATGLGESEAAT